MLGAYLHRDFDLEYRTAEDAFNNSVAEAGPERLTRAAAEPRTHRPPHDDLVPVLGASHREAPPSPWPGSVVVITGPLFTVRRLRRMDIPGTLRVVE